MGATVFFLKVTGSLAEDDFLFCAATVFLVDDQQSTAIFLGSFGIRLRLISKLN
jgi:hypothetical protein